MTDSLLHYDQQGAVGRITFNRPDIHNAFNAAVIDEMAALFTELADDSDLRVVVLTGAGKSFCAGADLNWMRSVVDQTYEQNLAESNRLADLFYQMHTFPRPIIARVNGAAIGGGTGFVAVCDIAIAAESAKFSFSEVKIGVVPACIGPYVIQKIGEGKARELFMTGERMDGRRAHDVGLVNRAVPDADLDSTVDAIVNSLLSSGPEAVATAKRLINEVPGMPAEEFRPYTAEMIAKIRLSPEGQEGMAAFLEKRKPSWVSGNE